MTDLDYTSKFTIKQWISLLIVIPIVFISAFAILELKNEYINYQLLKKDSLLPPAILASSNLVHHLQIERGISNVFLSEAGFNEKTLAEARQKTDRTLNTYSKINESNLLKADASLTKKLQEIKFIRNKIDRKNLSKGDAVHFYSEIISSLLTSYNFAYSQANSMFLKENIRSLRTLEDAKERGGLLRASLSAIFGENRPVESKLFSKLNPSIYIMSSILMENKIYLSDAENAKISQLLASPHWQEVVLNFNIFQTKHKEGDYQVNSITFFNGMTKILSSLGKIITSSQKNNYDLLLKSKENQGIYLVSLSLLLLLMLVLTSFGAFSVYKKIQSMLASIISQVSATVLELRTSTSKLASSSSELSTTVAENNASLSSTSKHVQGVSEQVIDNTAVANNAKQRANLSQEHANKGKELINSTVFSINENKKTNQVVLQKLSEANTQLKEISIIFKNIVDRTRVIGDIVFQTKLLSFNAAIEAARAGEQGRGFSVVADEIGNLARMSGTSAEAISSLLAESISKVNLIVNNMQHGLTQVINKSATTTEDSIRVAQDSAETFIKIFEESTQLSIEMDEVFRSSEKQSNVIQDVSESLLQLEDTTKQSASVSKETAHQAEILLTGTKSLSEVILSLRHMAGIQDQMQEVKSPKMDKKEKSQRQRQRQSQSQSQSQSQNKTAVKTTSVQSLPKREDTRFEDI